MREAPSSSELIAELEAAVSGEVRGDPYTRHLYATDASMYTMVPLAVVYPRDEEDVTAAVRVAARLGVPVLPRGAGTGLAGETVARAVVLDFSTHMDRILELDAEGRRARVQPGVIQDDLNRVLAPHGLFFAPDTSTSSRATLGGMIGNNSCGARSARYGMTIDHVESLRVVLADGTVADLGPTESGEVARKAEGPGLEARLYRDLPPLMARGAETIRRNMPKHWRRSGGYRLERMLPEAGPFDLSRLVVGGQGTLAVVVEATVRLEPLPKAVSGLVGHFETVDDALAGAVLAMEAGATTVELVDRMILDLARTAPGYGHLAERLTGRPGAILWVEIYGASVAEASGTVERLRRLWIDGGHGYAHVPATSEAEIREYRDLRKAGLGLLNRAGLGGERVLAFVEDTAVALERLPEYARSLAAILEEEGLKAAFYGHASAGCIHLRPLMDLSRPGEVERMRRVAERVLELVMAFGGMNSSEHGDGLARSEFNPRFFGSELYGMMERVKEIFDPHGRFNPGKKVQAPPMTDHLHLPTVGSTAGRLETHFSFDADDGGMGGMAQRCVRVGACRKSPAAGGTMCPSYMATRQEEHSTRGRANALARALTMDDPRAALGDHRLHEILDLCLECKACQSECPVGVDMAKLKAEFLSHHHEIHGAPLRSRFFARARELGRLGAALAPVSNALAQLGPVRDLLDRTVGIDRRRPLPRFRRRTLQRWARERQASDAPRTPARGEVVFLADSFTSFSEPEIGQAAIELLEAAGFHVHLAGKVCCGRAAISKGLLAEARDRQDDLVARLAPAARRDIPIVGCEPSCLLTLQDELPALATRTDDARAVGERARLVEEVLADALEDGALCLDPDSAVAGRTILFHGHCHQQAARRTEASIRVLRAIPGARVRVLDAGCCGMAGSFGFETEHYDLSMAIGAQRLFPAMNAAPEDALISASGVSCRQQIAHGTGRRSEHPVVLLRRALAPSGA